MEWNKSEYAFKKISKATNVKKFCEKTLENWMKYKKNFVLNTNVDKANFSFS